MCGASVSSAWGLARRRTYRIGGAGEAAMAGSKPTVGGTGEFALIRAIGQRLPTASAIRIGPGDDAAVLAADDGAVVATTDLLVEGRHFRKDWSEPYDVGRKAAAQSLADIAAMGGVPTGLLVGLAVPATLDVDWVLSLADGLRDECEAVGASVAGGDIVRS